MLKICTDTYKIIDKNIPLLTIHLGGKPCERLEGAGWLAGGFRGWVGDCEEAWAVVLLGLGLLLGLFWGCLHLRYIREQKRVRPESQTPRSPFKSRHLKGSSPRWSWPRRSQSGSPRLPLPQHSPLPSWSSCPPSYRSQPFLSVGREDSVAACCVVENSHTWGRARLPLLPSWLLVQAWAGPVSMTIIDRNHTSVTLIQHCLIMSTFPLNYSYYLSE